MTARARLALAALVVLALSGCATSGAPPMQPLPQETYLHALEDATQVYETTRQAIHRAHIDGLITDKQNERIAKVGRKAEASLRTAAAALNAWIALGETVNHDDLDKALLSARRAVADLVGVWAGGVK